MIASRTMVAFFLPVLTCATLRAEGSPASQPDWADAVRAVHARFKGKPGGVGQYGDSITHSKAFFSNMFWGQFKFADEADKALLQRFRQQTPRHCADWKEPAHGNYSGWQIEDVLKVIDDVLVRDNPQIALVMIGTNDLKAAADPSKKDFADKLGTLIEKLHANGTVAVLHTIPPRRGKMPEVEAYNKVIRQLAGERKLPLVDYFAAVLARRPDDWDGSLISSDGVHPSFPKDFQQDFTADGLRNSGHTLRNYLALKAWGQIMDVLAQPAGDSGQKGQQ